MRGPEFYRDSMTVVAMSSNEYELNLAGQPPKSLFILVSAKPVTVKATVRLV